MLSEDFPKDELYPTKFYLNDESKGRRVMFLWDRTLLKILLQHILTNTIVPVKASLTENCVVSREVVAE